MAGSNYNSHIISMTTVVVFGSSFQFGFNIGCLNLLRDYVLVLYRDLKEERSGERSADFSSYEYNAIFQTVNSLLVLGGVIGAFLGGYLADRLGRTRTLLFSQVFTGGGVIMMTSCRAAISIEMLMIGRVLVGVANGIGNAVVPVLLSECSTTVARGAIITSHQLLITIGILVGNLVGFRQLLGENNRWNYVFLVLAVSMLVLVVCLPMYPETPRYLVMVRRDEEAGMKSLQFYRDTQDVQEELSEMLEERDVDDEERKKNRFKMSNLFSDPDLRRATLVSCFLQIVQQLSGINAIMFYSNTVYGQAGVNPEYIQYTVAGTSLVNVLATIVAVRIMDVFGRRKLLLIPMTIIVFDFILLTIALNFVEQEQNLAYLAIACVLLYVIMFAVGLGPIPMTIASEMFRQEPRPKAMMVSGWTNWLFTFIIGMTFEHVQKACEEYTFLIFAALMVIFLVICFIYVPETKNRTVEDISNEMAGRNKSDGEGSSNPLERLLHRNENSTPYRGPQSNSVAPEPQPDPKPPAVEDPEAEPEPAESSAEVEEGEEAAEEKE